MKSREKTGEYSGLQSGSRSAWIGPGKKTRNSIQRHTTPILCVTGLSCLRHWLKLSLKERAKAARKERVRNHGKCTADGICNFICNFLSVQLSNLIGSMVFPKVF